MVGRVSDALAAPSALRLGLPIVADKPSVATLAATGITGCDSVVLGGLAREHLYLVEGTPGAGKTTLALQFLLEGVRSGERCLYITLSETERELHATALSHNWSLG